MNKELYDKIKQDPYRPLFHFSIGKGNGFPGDPNGAFYADGRYHLMYLYHDPEPNVYCWGHISSSDLLHWNEHPDAIGQLNGDGGCFSGGAYVDDNGTAWLSFWKFPAADGSDHGGIALASSNPPYDIWERSNFPEIPGLPGQWGIASFENPDGETEYIGCADPSNIWKKDGIYYMQTGNKCVLDSYGRADDSPERYKGDWTDLFCSEDLKEWKYMHRFYQRDRSNCWTDYSEDDMCPSFLPLPRSSEGGKASDRYLQLFIAHNRGTQYYIGTYKDDYFYPEQHGRMSWKDNSFFAPEALIDGKGRQIMWAWLLDNQDNDYQKYGWSGVYSLPRVLWLGDDNTLKMAPATELDTLNRSEQIINNITLNEDYPLQPSNPECCRIKVIFDRVGKKTGIYVKATPDKDEITYIYYDSNEEQLVFSSTEKSNEKMSSIEKAPFKLNIGEELKLDVIIDRSIIEVYANDRQAICRRVFSHNVKSAIGIGLTVDGIANAKNVTVWNVDAESLYE